MPARIMLLYQYSDGESPMRPNDPPKSVHFKWQDKTMCSEKHASTLSPYTPISEVWLKSTLSLESRLQIEDVVRRHA